MLGESVKALVQRMPWDEGVQVLLVAGPRFPGDQRYVATSVSFEPMKEGEFAEPTFRLRSEEAQALMDGLWAAGIRPTEGHGSTGQLGAIERHLADMRMLVQKSYEVKL